jgi:hypothetical protein
MADYAKVTVAFVYSENSDYSDPIAYRSFSTSFTTPTKVEQHYVSAKLVGDGSTTIDLSGFSAVQGCIIKNKDAANFVTAAFTSVGAGGASSQKILAAAPPVLLCDLVIADDLVLTADTAACDVEILLFGT